MKASNKNRYRYSNVSGNRYNSPLKKISLSEINGGSKDGKTGATCKCIVYRQQRFFVDKSFSYEQAPHTTLPSVLNRSN